MSENIAAAPKPVKPQNLAPPTESAEKAAKAKRAPKEKKEPTVRRSRFAELYPDNAKVTVLVKENPKKKESKSAERFEAYFKASTVGEALAGGVTYQDLAWDVGHGLISITKV